MSASGPGTIVAERIASLQRAWPEGLSTCLISDNMPEARVLEPGLQRVGLPTRFIGAAITAHAPDADNLAVWDAIARSRPGSVLVIATGRNYSSAILGGNVARAAHASGIVAILTDGLIRDIEELPETLAAVAAGVTPRSPVRRAMRPRPGRVALAGVEVADDEVVVGDGNGIAVLPPDAFTALCDRLDELIAAEQRQAELFGDPTHVRRFLDESRYQPG